MQYDDTNTREKCVGMEGVCCDPAEVQQIDPVLICHQLPEDL